MESVFFLRPIFFFAPHFFLRPPFFSSPPIFLRPPFFSSLTFFPGKFDTRGVLAVLQPSDDVRSRTRSSRCTSSVTTSSTDKMGAYGSGRKKESPEEKARRAAQKRTVLANNRVQAAALQSMLHPKPPNPGAPQRALKLGRCSRSMPHAFLAHCITAHTHILDVCPCLFDGHAAPTATTTTTTATTITTTPTYKLSYPKQLDLYLKDPAYNPLSSRKQRTSLCIATAYASGCHLPSPPPPPLPHESLAIGRSAGRADGSGSGSGLNTHALLAHTLACAASLKFCAARSPWCLYRAARMPKCHRAAHACPPPAPASARPQDVRSHTHSPVQLR